MRMSFSDFTKLLDGTVFDQKELRELANESQWMSIEEYVKKNDLDLDEFLGCASSNGEPMSPDAKLPIDELDHYASYCDKSSRGFKEGKVLVFRIKWDTHDETDNPLPSRAKLTIPTPSGKVERKGVEDALKAIYKVAPVDFEFEDLTEDLPHGMFSPSWGERVKEEKMKRINENIKITLTIGQLRRLVKESMDETQSPLTKELKDAITRAVNGMVDASNKVNGYESHYGFVPPKFGYLGSLDYRGDYELYKLLKVNGIEIDHKDCILMNAKKIGEIHRRYGSKGRNLSCKQLKPTIEWLV